MAIAAGGMSITAGDMERLESLLASFLEESQATSVLLLDRAGRFLTAVGETDGLDPTTFATLAAADFAASDQLAQLLGEGDFASLYHAGARHSMYLADVGGEAIVAALFGARTTLGLVRLRSRGLVARLGELFGEIERRPPEPTDAMDEGWVTAASDEIDRLFSI